MDASIAQWIEQLSSKELMWVRFLLEAHYIDGSGVVSGVLLTDSKSSFFSE
jgi:hypothetical protein